MVDIFVHFGERNLQKCGVSVPFFNLSEYFAVILLTIVRFCEPLDAQTLFVLENSFGFV